MKIYVYDFTETGIQACSSKGDGADLSDDGHESERAMKIAPSWYYEDMSMLGREKHDGETLSPISFFSGVSDRGHSRSIGFGDLLISAYEDFDLFDEMNSF